VNPKGKTMDKRIWSSDLQHLGDQIVRLTLAQAAELSEYLEVVHGVRAAATAVVEPDTIVPDDKDQPAPPTEFDVVLEGFDATRKIGVIKAVRELTGLGLKDAKDLVEGGPKVLKEGLAREDAEKLKAKLEAFGARVTLKAATSTG
jgi:large subunit ribosomal protein L7/L12